MTHSSDSSAEEIKRQRAFVDRLSRDRATESGELETIAQTITEGCAGLLKVERVGVWLFNEEETELRCIDQFNLSTGSHSSGAILKGHEFQPEFQALKDSSYVDAHDPLTDPRTAGYVEGYLKPNRITSMLDVVIRFGGRNLGTLCFEHVDRPHTWAQHEIDFGCLVGSQLSVLLERKALRKAEDARRESEERLKAIEELHALKDRWEEMRSSRDEARRLLSLRDEFISVASHELKTPLTPIVIQHMILGRKIRKDGSVSAGDLEKFLESSDRQLKRMSTLIDELLDVSRISLGRLSIQVSGEVDLVKIVKDVISRFAPVLQEAGCQINLNSPESKMGDWDPGRIEQVVTNLLTNAMKYGAGKPIEIRIDAREGRSVLTVRDHGIGIAESDLERIFDRFERAVSMKDFSGLGLGLYVSRSLIEAHRGSIRVESEPGKGSTFIVELPEKLA